MKAKTKRVALFVCIVVSGLALQWLSGLPFQRSPEQAFYAFATFFFAWWLAICPFIEDDQ
jgi:hypothetical protein